jgi:hypothetical protein
VARPERTRNETLPAPQPPLDHRQRRSGAGTSGLSRAATLRRHRDAASSGRTATTAPAATRRDLRLATGLALLEAGRPVAGPLLRLKRLARDRLLRLGAAGLEFDAGRRGPLAGRLVGSLIRLLLLLG